MYFFFRNCFRFLNLLLWILICKSYTAQQYSFYNFNEQSGLSKNAVLGINQDLFGKIYLGTNDGGINVIDGINVSHITKNKGLTDNVVYDIVDYDKNEYLITTNNGVNILRKGYINKCYFKDSLVSTRVFSGLKLSNNLTLLGTGEGLSKLQFDTIFPYTTESTELNFSSIIHIREGKSRNVWCSTVGNGVFLLKTNGEVEHYQLADKLDYTFQTFQYDDKTVWFLTYRGVYQLRDGVVSEVNIICNQHLRGVYYHSCIRDSKDNIWIATLKGVIKIDREGNQRLLTMEDNGLAGNDAWKIFEDREQNIWIAFKTAGVSKLTSEIFSLYNENSGIMSTDVKSIFIDNGNNKWLGTNAGVYKFEKDSLYSFAVGHKTRDEIKAIDQLNEAFFFLSIDGVNKFQGGQLKNINTLDDNRFVGECIFIDSSRVFFGSSVSGVAEFKDNKIVYINDSIGLDRIGVFAMNKTQDDYWWYATEDGLHRHNGKQLIKITENNGIKSGKTRSLVLDKKGRLWVGNSEGVFYRENDQFFPVYKDDTVNNNSIYSLCFDLEGNLWAGKIDGIDKITIVDEEVKSIRRYDTQKGLNIGSLHNNAIALDQNGHILVGTDRGLLEINPYLDFPNTVESKTHIEEIRLFSQPTDWSIYADSIDENGFPIDLELDYNQNYFTFNYIGICHKFPEGVRYKTKLEGLDKDWVDRKDKRFVIYGNLKPDSYTFLLKSSNNEGIWNKEPIRFSFVIRPPFWQTWWFYGICFVIFMAGVYSYVRIRSANYEITLKNDEITLKNQEIEAKNHEILDSINYAKRIQDTMLPDNLLKDLIPTSFVYFQPKDIVSGDFYWIKQVEDELLFAAVDCTGHGVPGAFVSMVGFGGLNRAVNEYKLTDPSLVLEKLSEFVVDSFAKHQSKSVNDGMDASLCSLNKKTNVLQYSGANNSIYIIRSSDKPILNVEGEEIEVKKLDSLNEIKSTRRPIGKSDNPVPFKNHIIQLEKGDTIYLFTDGFPDQFGGPKGKKYMYKRFKRFLISIQNLPIENQGEKLKEEYNNWASGYEQVDDICIVGVQV